MSLSFNKEKGHSVYIEATEEEDDILRSELIETAIKSIKMGKNVLFFLSILNEAMTNKYISTVNVYLDKILEIAKSDNFKSAVEAKLFICTTITLSNTMDQTKDFIVRKYLQVLFDFLYSSKESKVLIHSIKSIISLLTKIISYENRELMNLVNPQLITTHFKILLKFINSQDFSNITYYASSLLFLINFYFIKSDSTATFKAIDKFIMNLSTDKFVKKNGILVRTYYNCVSLLSICKSLKSKLPWLHLMNVVANNNEYLNLRKVCLIVCNDYIIFCCNTKNIKELNKLLFLNKLFAIYSKCIFPEWINLRPKFDRIVFEHAINAIKLLMEYNAIFHQSFHLSKMKLGLFQYSKLIELSNDCRVKIKALLSL